MAAPRLTHVFNLSAYSDPIAFPTELNNVCNTYSGPVEGGEFSTVDGKITLPVVNAADWFTLEASGIGIIVDARVTARNEEHTVDLKYKGKLHFGPELMEVFTGKKSGTEWGEAYFYTTPAIASRTEELKWVNQTVFLSQGRVRITEKGKLEVSYRIFRVD